jgi:hypothetical protein
MDRAYLVQRILQIRGPFARPTEDPLPKLAQFEEMLIARLHAYIEITTQLLQISLAAPWIAVHVVDGAHRPYVVSSAAVAEFMMLLLLPNVVDILVLCPTCSKDGLCTASVQQESYRQAMGCGGDRFTCQVTLQEAYIPFR